jgi:hypothetical protein
MHDGLVVKAVAAICALAITGCSLWLNTGERQCGSDNDCVEASLGTKCVQQVCMDTSECSGGACDASTSSSELGVGVGGACASDSDCNAKTPRCLNETCVDSQTGDTWLCPPGDQTVQNATVRYSFRVVEFISRMPPKNVVAKACYNTDVGCAEPVATHTDMATGHVQFVLPTNFNGFFEIKSDAVDTLLYVTKPIVKNTNNRDVPVLTLDGIDLLASLLGYPYDPSKGLTLIEALDCSETPQGGVHFISREGGDSFYLKDQVPNKDAQMTVYDPTNNTANGGFINVPPGFVDFTAKLGVGGLELGSFNAQVRARTITFIDMHF